MRSTKASKKIGRTAKIDKNPYVQDLSSYADDTLLNIEDDFDVGHERYMKYNNFNENAQARRYVGPRRRFSGIRHRSKSDDGGFYTSYRSPMFHGDREYENIGEYYANKAGLYGTPRAITRRRSLSHLSPRVKMPRKPLISAPTMKYPFLYRGSTDAIYQNIGEYYANLQGLYDPISPINRRKSLPYASGRTSINPYASVPDINYSFPRSSETSSGSTPYINFGDGRSYNSSSLISSDISGSKFYDIDDNVFCKIPTTTPGIRRRLPSYMVSENLPSELPNYARGVRRRLFSSNE